MAANLNYTDQHTHSAQRLMVTAVLWYLDFAKRVSDVLWLCRLKRDGQDALCFVQPAQHRAHVLLQDCSCCARLCRPAGVGGGGERKRGKEGETSLSGWELNKDKTLHSTWTSQSQFSGHVSASSSHHLWMHFECKQIFLLFPRKLHL